MRFFVFNLLLSLSLATNAGAVAQAPDDILLGHGQKWHYRTTVAVPHQTLKKKEPTPAESPSVSRAQEILNRSSVKAILLMNGNEIVWAGYKAPANSNSLFQGFSMAKTVTSMAVGKAICSDKFSLQDQAEKHVAELKGTHLGSVTVQQLLKMSSGTASINPESTVYSNTIYSPEQSRGLQLGKLSVLDVLKTSKVSDAYHGPLGGKRKAGEEFNYHSTDPLLLGVIINLATGMNYAQWVEKQVLIPAGISHAAIIGQDHFGFGAADGNVRMTLEDWGRFAYWVKTNENGSDCFAGYVKDASRTQIRNSSIKQGKGFNGYGYLVWTDNIPQSDSYWANGYGGQRIGWNHRNNRMLIAFSNAADYTDDLYRFYADWSQLPD